MRLLAAPFARSCHIVLMNARDEETSFRIFSTLNSRGMDLTMVDKLKADLLQVCSRVPACACNGQQPQEGPPADVCMCECMLCVHG